MVPPPPGAAQTDNNLKKAFVDVAKQDYADHQMLFGNGGSGGRIERLPLKNLKELKQTAKLCVYKNKEDIPKRLPPGFFNEPAGTLLHCAARHANEKACVELAGRYPELVPLKMSRTSRARRP